MKVHLHTLTLSFVIMLAIANPASAQSRQDCMVEAADMYVALFELGHTGMRDIVEKYQPKYSQLANFRMETQIAASRLTRAKVRWLAATHPEWLTTDEGPNGQPEG